MVALERGASVCHAAQVPWAGEPDSFPLVTHRRHFAEARRYIEERYGAPFDVAFVAWQRNCRR